METWKRATYLTYTVFFLNSITTLHYPWTGAWMLGLGEGFHPTKYHSHSSFDVYIHVSINDMCLDKLNNELLGFTAPVVKSVPLKLLPDLST